MFDIIQLIEFFLVYQVSLLEIFVMSFHLAIKTLPFVLPIACIFASISVYGSLSHQGESVAFSALGFHRRFLLMPAFILGGLVFWLAALLSFEFSPLSEASLTDKKKEIRASKVSAFIQPGVFIKDFENVVLYIQAVDMDKNQLKGIFIRDEREANDGVTIVADSGEFLSPETKNKAPMLKLYNGALHRLKNKKYLKAGFKSYEMNIFSSQEQDEEILKTFTYHQLKAQAFEKTESLQEQQKWLIELHGRWALSFSCLLMALLGTLIGLQGHRRSGSHPLTWAVCVTAGYWIFYGLMTGLGQRVLWVHPMVFVWCANMVLMAWIYKRVQKKVG